MKTLIEFQFFQGCPHSKETLKNLLSLVEEGFLKESQIIITEVPDPETAQKLNFQGSPTILLNGYDIYTERRPESFNYSCRIYNLHGKQTGILPREYIKAQIEKLKEKLK
ncbi:MAG: alkylmercury lyase [Candidatus Saccharicenans sp.]|nr:MAG: alkylmercury lyase [Candidatus Aminicenantes bacterium]HEK85876.1 alkylmercury lyase [Candidatus Aminicenantes bacterium]